MKQAELNAGFAKCLKDLRLKRGLSIAKMADALYLSESTWAKYERGESVPSAAEFMRIYNTFGENMLRPILEMLYPTKRASNTEDMRNIISNFILHDAADQMIEDLYYLFFAQHGSALLPQLEEFVVIDHLPIDYRIALAKNAITFFKLAKSRGELVLPDDMPPDFELIISAIYKAMDAAEEHRNSYTLATED